MARQPVRIGKGRLRYSIGANAIAGNPALQALIGRCVSNWSNIELQLALTMGSMLGVENAASVAVFGSLKNHRAQREALIAAATHSLSPNLREIFDALLLIHKRLDGQRNDIVHGIWGRWEAKEDPAIWLSMQDYANYLISAYHSESSGQKFDRSHELLKRCFLWPLQDIEDLNDEMSLLAIFITHFHAHLRYGSSPAGAKSLRLLESELLPRKEVQQMRNSPEKPQQDPLE